MEDVTDTVFRQLLARWAAPDVFFTEFVNVDGMCSPGREAVIHRLRHTALEHPLVAQIWGLKPENFERAAKEIREMGFDGVDLNMGCPVKKVIKTGACSALIDNPSLANEMILAAKEGAGDMPVSVKTRIGFKKKVTLEWAGFLLEHDLAALIVHGRITKNGAGVPADWTEIGKVVTLRDQMKNETFIIGNGDITAHEQIHLLAKEYGVDGVMIGRGVIHDPLVFRTPGSASFMDLEISDKVALMKEHIILYREIWGDEKNFNIIKKFAKTYITGFDGAARLRACLMDALDHREMLEILESPQFKE
jgi:tRNA-dihydrouridine synthase